MAFITEKTSVELLIVQLDTSGQGVPGYETITGTTPALLWSLFSVWFCLG